MAIAITLQEYLDNAGVEYDLIEHPYSSTSMQAAQAAHVPGDRIAKSVLLEDEHGYVLAVIPATHRLDLGNVHRQLNRMVGLATERELADVFADCEEGAVPPLGQPYGVEVIIDESLAWQPDIYFEAGDHVDLVHITGEAFQDLLGDVEQGQFSRHL
ncbi:MAG: YbaK/EbsC family protein [Gammaproteobacteria bacterium]|nr:YbaK/EbsC family protein [Gammaproteobacteria bacterium]